MRFHTGAPGGTRSARSKTEVLEWASSPPAGAVLTEITTVTRLSGSGYRVYALLYWERPPFATRWVDRRVSHEMSCEVTHTWPARPSPAAILRAISSAVLVMSTRPATTEMEGQMTLPGL